MNARIQRARALAGISVPVLGAPMAAVAGGALAAAVSNAGGLGLIGGGYGDVDWISQQLSIAAGSRVGVGLITWKVAERPEVLEAVLSMPIAALCLSFGDPAPALAAARSVGIVTICQIQTAEEARHAAALGADLIVAQGHEAGGHGRSGCDVLSLLASTVEAIDPVPVLAAGGITTVGDAHRAVEAGAAGVMLGTRLYATDEALDIASAKQALVRPGPRHTIRTSVIDLVRGPRWPAGYDGRAMANDLVTRWHERPDDLEAVLPSEQERYRNAAAIGDLATLVVWAGTGVERLDRLLPAGEVVRHFDTAFG